MKASLLLALTALLVLPSAAAAATATADTENRLGTHFGPVTFKAARGEENSVTVTQTNGNLRFRDSQNAVTASGDCDQVNEHTASCPVTEDIAKVKLRNGDDTASVAGLVRVLGGSGADSLRGSVGIDILNGQRGGDVLRGRGDSDNLTGGRGPDRLFGGEGDDALVDGESDARATADLVSGGAGRDDVDYSKRDRSLDINLARVPIDTSPDGDDIQLTEGVVGGSANDRLTGDGNNNSLDGNGGDDRLRGHGDADTLNGGGGEDSVEGGTGDDVVTGDRGTDSLDGGGDHDLLVSGDGIAEILACGAGDDDARTERLDTLEDCEVASSDPLYIQVQPEISGNTATFQVACQQLGGCKGTLQLNGPNGEDFGSGSLGELPDDPRTFSSVSVTLTDAGVAALAQGVVVEVSYSDTGGYRAFMQSG